MGCFGGGKKVKDPGPSPEEIRLREEELDIARQQVGIAERAAAEASAAQAQALELQRQQLAFQNQISQQALGLQRKAFGLEQKRFVREEELFRLQMLLFPTQLEQLGLKSIRDKSGKITGFERDPDSLAERQRQLSVALTERALQAVEGELPVPKALERAFAKRQENLRETFRRNLGEGFETSTPFIEASAEEGLIAETAFDAARRDDLVTATQLASSNIGAGLTRTLQTQGGQLQAISPLSGSTSLPVLNAPLPGVPSPSSGADFLRASIGALGAAGQGIRGVGDAFQNDRSLALRTAMFNAEQGGGGIGGIFGSIAGGIVGGATGEFGSILGGQIGKAFGWKG